MAAVKNSRTLEALGFAIEGKGATVKVTAPGGSRGCSAGASMDRSGGGRRATAAAVKESTGGNGNLPPRSQQ